MGSDSTLVYSQRFRVKTIEAARLRASFAEDVRQGLSARPKRLSPRYFYDEQGSQLFERVTELPEYYLTRTETEMLRRHVGAMLQGVDAETALVELGSGSSTKTRLIFDAFLERSATLHYLPMDISKTMLVQSCRTLLKEYAALEITGYVAQYEEALAAIGHAELGRKLIFFLGSSIGNLEPRQARDFLARLAGAMSAGDAAIIGFDAQKEVRLLEAAYNDAQGVTAAFNLNLLRRINRELEANFDLEAFTHYAPYNTQEGRIEMHLVSTREQLVTIGATSLQVSLRRGESIHTENSYKYTRAQIQDLADSAGLRLERTWTDAGEMFFICRFVPA